MTAKKPTTVVVPIVLSDADVVAALEVIQRTEGALSQVRAMWAEMVTRYSKGKRND